MTALYTYSSAPAIQGAGLYTSSNAPTPIGRTEYIYVNQTEAGTKSNVLSFQFIYTSIDDLIPNPAPYPGSITIIGIQLDRVTGVTIDGVRCSFRILSDTEIWAALPYPISSFDDVPVYVNF